MGTRNLTIVINNNETKIAQYGQWDGYPSGQGATALKFLRDNDIEKFKNKLSVVRFANEQDNKEKDAFLKSIGSVEGWVSMEQGRQYDAKYKWDSRNHAAEILQMIIDSEDSEIVLNDSYSFAADSLFCEWAYVIDLDKKTFEVYEGFNKSILDENERFKGLETTESEYKPVKLVKSYSLGELPTEEEFIEYFNQEVEEEE